MAKPLVTPVTVDTRTRLLQAAHALIWQNSYSGVSVDDICQRASVNKGSFYHFFPSKNALAVAALHEHWETMLPEFHTILTQPVAPVQKIKMLVQFIHKQQKEKFEEIGHVCGCPYAALGSEISMQEETLRLAIKAKLDTAIDFLEKLLTNDASAVKIDTAVQEKARAMDSFIIGVMTTARIYNSLATFEKDLEAGLLRISGLNE